MNKFLFTLAAFLLLSCSKDKETPQPVDNPKAILEILENDSKSSKPQYTILLAAIKKTDLKSYLSNSGAKMTFFAPTDEAFKEYFRLKGTTLETESASNLYKLLSYHLITNQVYKSSDFITGYFATAYEDPNFKNYLNIHIKKIDSAIYINNTTTVTSANISASNGIMHGVNRVLDYLTIEEAITSNFDLIDFLGKMNTQTNATGNILYGSNALEPITFFALKNEEFKATKNYTEVQFIAFLKDHIVKGNFDSNKLSNDQLITNLNAKNIKINKTPTYISLIDDTTFQSDFKVTDVQCSNGIIHIVSKILMFK
jgi:uncharacterized surface protein with fasciclin (FAS1) repeats